MDKISAALVAALAEMPSVPFDEENKFLKSKFSSLGAVIKTAQPVLAKHKLAIVQMPCSDEVGRIGVETRLIHESGEYLTSTIYLPMIEEKGKSDSQVAGSIISYLRRYSLASMLFMYSDQDTDGNQPPAKAQPEQPRVEIHQDVEPKMALATAEAVVGSDGVAYGKKVTAELGNMFNSIAKNLKKNDLSPDERDKLEYKSDAIEVILAARKNEVAK